MAAASDDNPARPTQHQCSGRGSEGKDDDALIEKLRSRAWDPGRRFDTTPIPIAWVNEHYGVEPAAHDGRMGSRSDGMLIFNSRAEAVAAYYADAPREPLFPPVSLADFEIAESRVGRRLPKLLRRVYTEVANGGFGPDAGLECLTDGNREQGRMRERPSAVRVYERNCAAGLPTSWFELAYGGCTMHWHVSLAAVNNPVLLHDTDGWDPDLHWDPDDGPHDGLRHATPSLRRWLWTWADGENVWDEALK
ncbi:hypothetical protein [Streptomyces sp. T028]|uniref:hypothetical protein n=1 Tax=Streptomyces sp. T028 TaxID=3394379 RepID=UPI003A841B31